MHQICVNEDIPRGWPVLLYDLMKEICDLPYIYICVYMYISQTSNRTLFILQININFSLKFLN